MIVKNNIRYFYSKLVLLFFQIFIVFVTMFFEGVSLVKYYFSREGGWPKKIKKINF